MNEGRVTADGTVSRTWLDGNGHVNVTHYMSLFDGGNDAVLEPILAAARLDDGDVTIVASRIYIEHKRELLQGEVWTLRSAIITLDSAFVTTTHRLTCGASLRARCDLRSSFFSRRSRTAVRVSETALSAGRHLLVAGVTDRFPVAAT